MEIREPILGLTVMEHELTAEEIGTGEYTIAPVESGDLYMAHMQEYDAAGTFPEHLVLRVTVRYDTAGGEETLEYTAEDAPELGWNMQYWADDEPASEWSYPGTFRFSSYESTVPVSLVVGSPEQAQTTAERVVLSVTLSINGREILPEECEIREEEEVDPLAEFLPAGEEPVRYYYGRLYLKRPEWAPEHGILHMKVVQQLAGDGTLWTTEKDVEY